MEEEAVLQEGRCGTVLRAITAVKTATTKAKSGNNSVKIF